MENNYSLSGTQAREFAAKLNDLNVIRYEVYPTFIAFRDSDGNTVLRISRSCSSSPSTTPVDDSLYIWYLYMLQFEGYFNIRRA